MQSGPLPSYSFREGPPSLAAMLRHGISDVARVIPGAILEERAIQLPGPGAPLVVADPVLARLVLNDREGDFARDKFLRRLFRRAWGHGLAGAEGEEWKVQRHAAAPAFSPQTVESKLAAFAAAVDAVAREPLEQVDLTKLSARIVARVVFSVLVDSAGKLDLDDVARVMPAYVRAIARFGPADLLPLPERLIDRIAGIDRDPAVRFVRNLAAEIAAGRESQAHDDLIGRLKDVGPVEDNIRGLIPAAMDTTVTGAGWALYLLARHPDWQSKVQEEGTRLPASDYSPDCLAETRRVVLEALRLYPPAPVLLRSAARPAELDGHHLHRGQPVVVLVYAMHRHRELWDRPDEFDPHRFGQGGSMPEAFLPFGVGPRVCIAAHFALMEICTIVARLCAQFTIAPIGAAPEVTLRVATRAVGGLPARLVPA